MGIANLVWHYLITTHHGSHYDYNIWVYYVQHPSVSYSRAFYRVLAILARGGI